MHYSFRRHSDSPLSSLKNVLAVVRDQGLTWYNKIYYIPQLLELYKLQS